MMPPVIWFRYISDTYVMKERYDGCIMNVYSKVPGYGRPGKYPGAIKEGQSKAQMVRLLPIVLTNLHDSSLPRSTITATPKIEDGS